MCLRQKKGKQAKYFYKVSLQDKNNLFLLLPGLLPHCLTQLFSIQQFLLTSEKKWSRMLMWQVWSCMTILNFAASLVSQRCNLVGTLIKQKLTCGELRISFFFYFCVSCVGSLSVCHPCCNCSHLCLSASGSDLPPWSRSRFMSSRSWFLPVFSSLWN